MVSVKELYFESHDGIHKIHAVKWIPDTEKPVCILQIVHGMAEHIERYDDFARFMAAQNILVVGDNHLGHGGSVLPNEPQGYFCQKDAAQVLVEDEKTLCDAMKKEYPEVPYVMLGHSMGSFIARNYLAQFGDTLQGAVIMGTGMQPLGLLKISTMLTSFLKVVQGEKHISKFLNTVAFGSYCKKITAPKTDFDWLTHDEKIVEAYEKDPDCGFVFTINGFATLFQLIKKLHDKNYIQQMPKTLPVFFVAGKEDPVGDYGVAVEKVYQSFADMGMKNVSCKLYDNMRHEILNEIDKMQVYKDLMKWICEVTSK